MSTYNFSKALERLDSRISMTSDPDLKYLPSIPRFEDCGVQNTFFVYGTVVSVLFDVSDDAAGISDLKGEQALACYASEVCEVFRSNSSCRDVIVNNQSITAVFSTSLKSEVNEVVDDLARAATLSMVVEKKLSMKKNTIKVKIAACYGKLSMSVVEYRNSYKQYLWRGEAMTNAIKMSNDAEAERILINKIVWNNLAENNQKLFHPVSFFEEDYAGRIVNTAMNNWLNTK